MADHFGIIVRNSIPLMDFIDIQVREGLAFKEAVVQSAAVRTQSIALIGLAAMIGAVFILDDLIFNGLAVTLIFGSLVSTLLTLVVIPVLYYALFRKRMAAAPDASCPCVFIFSPKVFYHDRSTLHSRFVSFFIMISLALGVEGSPFFGSK
jgi:hypothetical protein